MRLHYRHVLAPALFAATLMVAPTQALADSVTIGVRADPAVDPHYQWLTTNTAYSNHLFSPLVDKDAMAQWIPALATEWKMVEPTIWEFKLREGVKFHNGNDFDADDVVYSFWRVGNVPNNPNPYTANIRSLDRVEKVDDHTIRIHTKVPDPLLPGPLGNIFIVDKETAENATTADFRSGKAAVGTGPYRYKSFTPGSDLVLERSDNYWGEKPHWDEVTFRIIPNDSARVAALLAGEVDAIDYPPSTEVPAIRKNPNTEVASLPSDRVIYLVPDVGRDESPFVTDKAGNPIPNPLRDRRVREAISLAINRDAMVARVMQGLADKANQFVPKGFVGYNPDLPELAYDPERAKALLAEAGYPDGFGLTIHCTNDRYVNDARICEAVGQMLSRIGIAMKVETMPKNVFFPKVSTYKHVHFSFILIGWGNSSTGTAGPFLTSIFHTADKSKRMGHGNRAHYSDPEYDRMTEDAVSTMDPAEREKKMQAAMAYIVDKMIGIPLHVQHTVIGVRKGLTAVPRVDEETHAMSIMPAR